MCGIVGIYSHEPVAAELYDSLIHLQHRGQDAAGILTAESCFYLQHGLGLVREIFTPQHLQALQGRVGIAHTRYPTAGGYSEADVQPLWIGSPRGVSLAHNGNVTNYSALADEFRRQHRHLNTSLDSEVLLLLLSDHLATANYADHQETEFFQQLCAAVANIYSRVEGSYSVVSLLIGKGLVAFRDPHGIRPLVWGERLYSDQIRMRVGATILPMVVSSLRKTAIQNSGLDAFKIIKEHDIIMLFYVLSLYVGKYKNKVVTFTFE